MTLPPFRDRRQLEDEDPVLVEGVPRRMLHSLFEWLDKFMIYSQRGATGTGSRLRFRSETLDRLERKLGLELGAGRTPKLRYEELKDFISHGDDLGLYVIDELLRTVSSETDVKAAQMNMMLSESASAYQVEWTGDRHRLIERVDATARSVVESVLEAKDRAAAHLQRAWIAAYGLDKNPSEAFDEAVEAVEAASWEVITPNDGSATLGKIISAIRAKPEKWDFILDGERDGHPMEDVAGMMDRLWKTQIRHATDGAESPLDVTPEQGQAAVHLAATLVHLFQTGAIKRLDFAD